jgi:hypothetical protein
MPVVSVSGHPGLDSDRAYTYFVSLKAVLARMISPNGTEWIAFSAESP